MSIPLGGLYSKEGGIEAGKISEHRPNTNIVTRTSEGVVPFGMALTKGTSGLEVKVPAGASGLTFEGVSGWSKDATNFDTDSYADNEPVGIVQAGVVQVLVEEAVAVGDVVRVRHTVHASDATKVPGLFAKTVDAGKTALIGGARFLSATSGAGVAAVELNGPYTVTADAGT